MSSNKSTLQSTEPPSPLVCVPIDVSMHRIASQVSRTKIWYDSLQHNQYSVLENAWNKGIYLVIAQKKLHSRQFCWSYRFNVINFLNYFFYSQINTKLTKFFEFHQRSDDRRLIHILLKKKQSKVLTHKARKHLYFFQVLINKISMCPTDASDLQQLIRYHAVPAMGPGGGVVNPQYLANGIAKIKSGKLKYGFWNDFCAKWHCRNSGTLNYYKKWRRIITAFICS